MSRKLLISVLALVIILPLGKVMIDQWSEPGEDSPFLSKSTLELKRREPSSSHEIRSQARQLLNFSFECRPAPIEDVNSLSRGVFTGDDDIFRVRSEQVMLSDNQISSETFEARWRDLESIKLWMDRITIKFKRSTYSSSDGNFIILSGTAHAFVFCDREAVENAALAMRLIGGVPITNAPLDWE